MTRSRPFAPRLLLALAAALLPSRAFADDDGKPDASSRVQEAQIAAREREIKDKVDSLTKNMRELAAVLEPTHEHEARLLREGFTTAGQKDLAGQIQNIITALDPGGSATPLTGAAREKSAALLEDLRALLAILEDRKGDAARKKIEERLEATKRAVDETKALEKAEAEIKEKIDQAR